jgi:thiamine pyrophosphokinase
LEKAFITFMKEKFAVNVVWATGKRTDHTYYNIVRYREKLEIVILDDHSKVFLLSKIRKMVYGKHPISHSFQ